MKRDQAKQIEAVQASAGCLARIFTLIGLFWLGSIVVASINAYQSGGDFAITGSFIPALVFLFAARVIRRRATEEAAKAIPAKSKPSQPVGGTTTSKGSNPERPIAAPSPTSDKPKPRAPDKQGPSTQKTTPPPPQPLVPPASIPPKPRSQPSPKPTSQPSRETVDDAARPLSSEEMIKRAKARYKREEDSDS